jgi:hypothetical protein
MIQIKNRPILKIVIAIVAIIAVIFVLKGCFIAKGAYHHSKSPQLKFIGDVVQKDGVPAFKGPVAFELVYEPLDGRRAFVEILTDEQYSAKKEERFVGGWGAHQGSWGGAILDASLQNGKAIVSVPSQVLVGSGGRKYWVRTAVFAGNTYQKGASNFDRVIYGLVGKPIDYKGGYYFLNEGGENRRYYASRYYPFWVLSTASTAQAATSTKPEVGLSEQAAHFEGANVSFAYPKEWMLWEKDSFGRMRSSIKSQGADLLVMLKDKYETCVMQVVKQRNPSSFESWYQDKKKFADQVTTKGIEIKGQRYVKYLVKIVDLPSNQKAIYGYAEKSNGGTAITYQLLSDGHEYNVNFIYQTPMSASKGEELRGQIMNTFKIIEAKKKK